MIQAIETSWKKKRQAVNLCFKIFTQSAFTFTKTKKAGIRKKKIPN